MSSPSPIRVGQTRYWGEGRKVGFRPVTSVPLADRGFRYGMALFETIRVHEGRLLFLPEHVALLEQSCRKAGFPVSAGRLRDAAAFLTTLVLNGEVMAPSGIGVARMHVTAGDGSPHDPPGPCRIFVSLEVRKLIDGESCRRGLRLRVYPRAHRPPMGGMKTHNYWSNLEALAWARRERADEALLCDEAGRLIGACMANVFVVQGDQLLTPPVSLGARPGVVRAWVLENFPAREYEIDGRRLAQQAPAIFLTNSWLGPTQSMLNSSVSSSKMLDTVISSYKSKFLTP